MSLNRQLVALLSFLFAALLVAVLGVSVAGTRSYLERQLASHAQDTATALSITLASALSRQDKVLAETQVRSVFDRGYFQRIELLDMQHDSILMQTLPRRIERVPLWFVDWVPIRPPTGEAFIGSGWRQLGKVLVDSQPTLAYQHLWQSTTQQATWLAVLYVASLVLAWLVVRAVLQPLHAIETTAIAVQDKRFVQIDTEPRAPELASVVRAMNAMSRKVGTMLESETRRAEHLRHLVYDDELTGLTNRRGLDQWLDQLLDGSTPFQQAWALSVELDDMRRLGRTHGFAANHYILERIAQTMRQAAAPFALKTLARSNDFAFTMVVVDEGRAGVAERAHQLQATMQATLQGFAPAQEIRVHVGVAFFNPQSRRSEIFARVDLAVESARQSERHGCVVLPQTADAHADMGSHAWLRTLGEALQSGRWQLVQQPVMLLPEARTVLHAECMLRMVDAQGHAIAAAVFVPMAARHRLLPEVDRAAVTLALERMHQTEPGNGRLALNLSHQSLAEPKFLAWLLAQTKALGTRAPDLSIEVSEFGVLRERDAAERALRQLRDAGVRVGIDHFGVAPQALALLREIRLDYIKLSATLTPGPDVAEASLQRLQSIVTLAHTLDVQVIAQMVGDMQQLAPLRAAGIDAAQGFALGAPT